VTTLLDVLEALTPDAAARAATLPAAADGSEPAHVGWVRVLRSRVPALDVLEPADLVVMPAAAVAVVAPGPADVGDLVQTLARSGASGLLLVPAAAEGPVPAAARDVLAEVEQAAAEAGIAAVRMDGFDPPTLERRLIGFLVDRRGELERQAAVLESDLAQLAMAGRGLDALAGAIGEFLRRAVAIEGRRSDALAVHAPADVPGAAAAVTAYLSRPHATGRRVPLPGAPGETAPAGYLVLLGDRPPGDLETIATERIAPVLSLELVLEAQVRRARDEAGRGEALPSDGPPWVVLVARQHEPAADGTGPSREDVRRELRFRFAARRLSLRGTSESLELRAIAALETGDPQGLRIAGRVADFLGRTVALSRPFSDPSARPAEEAAARATLEAAERLAEPPTVARSDRLPAYRMLAALGNLPDDRIQATALLEPILGGRPASVRERLATLRAILDHGASGEAAAHLGIHRNTLAYRVRNLERTTGWDLADPDLRLALSVAVRIVKSAQ
jgi:DNA-binding PucR family transcriptional regulator